MHAVHAYLRTYACTYVRAHARTYSEKGKGIRTYVRMWRRRIAEAHHSHPPPTPNGNMRTCVCACARANMRGGTNARNLRTYVRTYVRTHLRTYVHLDVCARMPCMHTYASTRARTYAQRKKRKEMWRRRMTEAHHSHPPRNVHTYVRSYARTYVRTYVRTHVRTLGRLRAHAVHAYAYVRTTK